MPFLHFKRLQSSLGPCLAGVLALSLCGAQATEPPVPPLPGGAGGAIPIEVETHTAVMQSRPSDSAGLVAELVPAREIREGQVVYYTLKIRNPGKRAAHNVVVTKPVPANTRYLPDTAVAPGATTSFSVDGGASFAVPRDLFVADEQGLRRPAAPEHYTHIRWQMRYPLAPGAVAFARFRAVFR